MKLVNAYWGRYRIIEGRLGNTIIPFLSYLELLIVENSFITLETNQISLDKTSVRNSKGNSTALITNKSILDFSQPQQVKSNDAMLVESNVTMTLGASLIRDKDTLYTPISTQIESLTLQQSRLLDLRSDSAVILQTEVPVISGTPAKVSSISNLQLLTDVPLISSVAAKTPVNDNLIIDTQAGMRSKVAARLNALSATFAKEDISITSAIAGKLNAANCIQLTAQASSSAKPVAKLSSMVDVINRSDISNFSPSMIEKIEVDINQLLLVIPIDLNQSPSKFIDPLNVQIISNQEISRIDLVESKSIGLNSNNVLSAIKSKIDLTDLVNIRSLQENSIVSGYLEPTNISVRKFNLSINSITDIAMRLINPSAGNFAITNSSVISNIPAIELTFWELWYEVSGQNLSIYRSYSEFDTDPTQTVLDLSWI